MHTLRESQSWLQAHADEEETDMLARVSTCMTDERMPLQDKQNVVQARPIFACLVPKPPNTPLLSDDTCLLSIACMKAWVAVPVGVEGGSSYHAMDRHPVSERSLSACQSSGFGAQYQVWFLARAILCLFWMPPALRKPHACRRRFTSNTRD